MAPESVPAPSATGGHSDEKAITRRGACWCCDLGLPASGAGEERF